MINHFSATTTTSTSNTTSTSTTPSPLVDFIIKSGVIQRLTQLVHQDGLDEAQRIVDQLKLLSTMEQVQEIETIYAASIRPGISQ